MSKQPFFFDALTDIVFTNAPYNSRGERVLRNDYEQVAMFCVR